VPDLPELPGIEGKNVVTAERLHKMSKRFLRYLSPQTVRALTGIWMPIGKRVVIVGGQIHGCEMAEFLVKRGRKVTLVESSGKLATGIPRLKKSRLLSWLTDRGVTILREVVRP